MKIINNSARTRELVLGPSRGVWLLEPGVTLTVNKDELAFLENTNQLIKGVSTYPPIEAEAPVAPVIPDPEPTPETPPVENTPAPTEQPETPPVENTPAPTEQPETPPVVIPAPEETTKAHLVKLANDYGVNLEPSDTKAQIYAKIKEKLA